MLKLPESVRNVLFSDEYSDAEKVRLLKKLTDPSAPTDKYTERLAGLCDVEMAREKERAERRRLQNLESQRRRRERMRAEDAGVVNKEQEVINKTDDVSAMSAMSAAVSNCHADIADRSDVQNSQKQQPSRAGAGSGARADAGARVTENNTTVYTEPIPIPIRPDTCARMTRARARGGPPEPIPVWTMDDERLMSGEFPTAAILRAALGPGCWRSAIQQIGEAEVLGEFAAFRAEIRAGEHVENRAAAFTARLVGLGYKARGEK